MVYKNIDLTNLPKKTYKNYPYIDWIQSIGNLVCFTYDDISGEILITGYNKSNQLLSINYQNNVYTIKTECFKRCEFKKIIGKSSSNYKFKKGQTLQSAYRDITIIDTGHIIRGKKREKAYKYHCNRCDYMSDWIYETRLTKNNCGCQCCGKSHQIVIKGKNDIATTNPEMVQYFLNKNDACLYFYSSDKIIETRCPLCGNIDKSKISNLYYKGFSCSVCSDGISFPEKIMLSILKQLKINYVKELNKSNFKWCKEYRYDFYLPDYGFIIETHGIQHYTESFSCGKVRLIDIQNTDRIKETLALRNNISKYLILDCRYSEIDWIKESILNSDMSTLFDLTIIDWKKCLIDASKSLVKEVCDYRNVSNESSKNIAYQLNLKRGLVIKYLKIGDKLGWCEYNPKEEMKSKPKKLIELTKDGINLGTYDVPFLVSNSYDLFKIKMSSTGIYGACNRKISTYKGFDIKYI